jgi:hypothetical protein
VRVPPQTLVDKIWARHAVTVLDGNETLLYVDRCLLHEGFWWNIVDSLKSRNLAIHRPSNIIACSDHFVPTTDRSGGFGAIADERRRDLILRLETEGAELGVNVIGMMDERQGILHVVAPETGITQPGMVIAGSDSHTSTHGALGAIAFGIGTTEAMHVLATETLWQLQPKTMRITVAGRLPAHATAKDLILTIIARLGIDGGAGRFVEYAGPAIEALTIEERLTVCNMSIELGARAGTIAPDETTFAYLAGRPHAPSGAHWDAAVDFWKTLRTDDGATFWTARSASTARAWRRCRPGAPRSIKRSRSTHRFPIPPPSRTPRSAKPRRGRSPTWACTPVSVCATCRSTTCSSARVPTGASTICAKRPPSCAAGTPPFPRSSRRVRGPSSAPLRPRVSTGSSSTRDSSGAIPAARCVRAPTAIRWSPAGAAPRRPTATSPAARGPAAERTS